MTPEQEEQVRRALAAAARPTADEQPPTMPPEVVARLDAVLADLVESHDRTAPAVSAHPHDELAARRRRRWANALVAAAAVAVIGAAGGAVVTGLGTTGASDSAMSSEDAGGGDGLAADKGDALSASPEAADAPELAKDQVGVPRLRTESLDEDVRRVVKTRAAFTSEADRDTGRSSLSSCRTPTVRRGERLIAVRLDGSPATMVLASPTDGAREARVFSCDDALTPLTRVRVPTR